MGHQQVSFIYLKISTYHTGNWPTYSTRTAVSHNLVKQNGGERKNETRGLILYPAARKVSRVMSHSSFGALKVKMAEKLLSVVKLKSVVL